MRVGIERGGKAVFVEPAFMPLHKLFVIFSAKRETVKTDNFCDPCRSDLRLLIARQAHQE
jgi:hypothetical protein